MQLDEWLCIGIPDEVMDQASAWLARLDADHVSLDERQRLSVWLDEDPLHRWAFEELSQLYARTATLSQVRGQIDAPQVFLFPQTPPPVTGAPATDVWPSPSRRANWQAIAVLLLIAVGLGFGIHNPATSKPATVQKHTPQQHIPLNQSPTPTRPGFISD
ncbi:FecR/PupR family sigma factor regulator [Microbulbifer bruguierae]|uniref:FecR/PupR family sigma factor regulator n=1 Tax=Microbulbifer bruguierae TaxID=3029061 RepID=A0ABY8NBW3_9GAMM|nr:FecR/PupR family sigma factor regulator [Microbulbifer bruguierae]WGL15547.1 FecR/PupR family sigma factor regulator [Microbulbifer bruguierae]